MALPPFPSCGTVCSLDALPSPWEAVGSVIEPTRSRAGKGTRLREAMARAGTSHNREGRAPPVTRCLRVRGHGHVTGQTRRVPRTPEADAELPRRERTQAAGFCSRKPWQCLPAVLLSSCCLRGPGARLPHPAPSAELPWPLRKAWVPPCCAPHPRGPRNPLDPCAPRAPRAGCWQKLPDASTCPWLGYRVLSRPGDGVFSVKTLDNLFSRLLLLAFLTLRFFGISRGSLSSSSSPPLWSVDPVTLTSPPCTSSWQVPCHSLSVPPLFPPSSSQPRFPRLPGPAVLGASDARRDLTSQFGSHTSSACSPWLPR